MIPTHRHRTPWSAAFRAGLALAILAVAPALRGDAAETLVGVAWHDLDDLSHLDADGLTLRHVAPGIALVSSPAGIGPLRARDLSILFHDRPAPGQRYFLSDHVHAADQGEGDVDGALVEVWRAPRGWSLMRLPADRLQAAIDAGHWLYPLPERYPVPRPAPAAKALARPASPAVQALIDQVDPARLRADVERLSFVDPDLGAVAGNVRSRYARRRETLESATFLRDQLAASLGADAVRLDSFRIAAGDSLMVNVVGEWPGTDPEAGYWVVCAHYDAIGARSKPSDMARIGETDRTWRWQDHPAPGADDNGSGVALVLESARLLSQRQFPWGIHFIAWSGEELGLWGSKHYAEAAAARGDHVLGVINMDMIGFNDLADRIELVSNPPSSWLVELMQATGERYGLGLRIDHFESRFAGLSDHAPFWAAGYDAILGIENYLPDDSLTTGVQQGVYRLNTQYHTVADLPDSVNWELVADITRLTVATLAQFGAEEGLPNLVVYDGDLDAARAGLDVRVANLGPVALEQAFDVRLSSCRPDSSDCAVVAEASHPGPLAAGAVARVGMPWEGLGDRVFLIEVDPDGLIAEESKVDNLLYERLRLVSVDSVVVYPNPFRPDADDGVRFSGVPRYARLRLFDAVGALIWNAREEDQPTGNEIWWQGTNDARQLVSPGVYLYDLRSFEGELLERGKIAVIR